MYKYFFVVCFLVPLEIYGYILTKTDIDKIEKTYTESAFSSVCLKVCQQLSKQPGSTDECTKGCLRSIIDSSINRLKHSAEKWKTSSLNLCTTKIKVAFPEESDPKEFNKLVQKCVDHNISQVMTKVINDLPSIIQQSIKEQGGIQKVEQFTLKAMRQSINSSKKTPVKTPVKTSE